MLFEEFELSVLMMFKLLRPDIRPPSSYSIIKQSVESKPYVIESRDNSSWLYDAVEKKNKYDKLLYHHTKDMLHSWALKLGVLPQHAVDNAGGADEGADEGDAARDAHDDVSKKTYVTSSPKENISPSLPPPSYRCSPETPAPEHLKRASIVHRHYVPPTRGGPTPDWAKPRKTTTTQREVYYPAAKCSLQLQ
jgi:hypothetical protein